MQNSTDPKKIRAFIRQKHAKLGIQKSDQELLQEYSGAIANPGQYITDSVKELGGATDVFSLRKIGSQLGVESSAFDAVEGVDYESEDIVDKIVDSTREINESENAQIISAIDDPFLDARAKKHVDAIQAANVFTGPTGLSKSTIDVDAELARFKDDARNKYLEHSKKKGEYTSKLGRADVPFVAVTDLIKKSEKKEYSPSEQYDYVKNNLDLIIQAKSSRLDELNKAVVNPVDRDAVDKMMAGEPLTDEDLKTPRSKEFRRFFGELNSFMDQVDERNAYIGKGEMKNGRFKSYEDEVIAKIDEAQAAKDSSGKVFESGSFMDIHSKVATAILSPAAGIGSIKNDHFSLPMEMALASGISTWNMAVQSIWGDGVSGDMEKRYKEAVASGDKKAIREVYNGMSTDRLSKKVKEFQATALPSSMSGPILDKYLDISGTRFRVDDKGELAGVITDSGMVKSISSLTGEEKEKASQFINSSNKDKARILKNMKSNVNYASLGAMVLQEGVKMAPTMGAGMAAGMAARGLGASLGVAAKAGAVAAGLETYVKTYGGNYTKYLEAKLNPEDARTAAIFTSSIEAGTTSVIGGLERFYGAVGAKMVKSTIDDAAFATGKEFMEAAATGKAAREAFEASFNRGWKQKARKALEKSGQTLKQSAGEVLEEVTTLVAQTQYDKFIGQGNGEISDNELVSTIAVSSILGGAFGSLNVSEPNTDSYLLYAGRNYDKVIQMANTEQGRWMQNAKDSEAKFAMLEQVNSGYKVSDDMSAKHKVSLKGEDVTKVERIILDRARDPESSRNYEQEIESIYEAARAAAIAKTKPKAGAVVPDSPKTDDDVLDAVIDDDDGSGGDPPSGDSGDGGSATASGAAPGAAATSVPSSRKDTYTEVLEDIDGAKDDSGNAIDAKGVSILVRGKEVRFNKDATGNWFSSETGAKADLVQINEIRNTITGKKGGLRTAPLKGSLKSNEGKVVKQGDFIGKLEKAPSGDYVINNGSEVVAVSDATKLRRLKQLPSLSPGQIQKELSSDEGSVDSADIGMDYDPITKTAKVEVFGEVYDYINTEYDADGNPVVFLDYGNGVVAPVRGENAAKIERDMRAADVISKLDGQYDPEIVQQIIEENERSLRPIAKETETDAGEVRLQEPGADTEATVGEDGDGSPRSSKPRRSAVVGPSGASTGSANAGAEPVGQSRPRSSEGANSTRGFGENKPYTSDRGKQYYFRDGWRRASDGRRVGGRELANLESEIAERVISRSNLISGRNKIRANAKLVTDLINGRFSVGSDFIENTIKEQDPALYEFIVAHRDYALRTGIEFVGFDNTADYEAATESVDSYVLQDKADAVKELQDKLRAKYPELRTLFLSADNGTMTIDMIEVDKAFRKRGIGGMVMDDVVAYADQVGLDIELVPGLQDDRSGTTSRGRLVRFYKRFGFVENKGRNKDFSRRSGGMYRTAPASNNERLLSKDIPYETNKIDDYVREIEARRAVYERFSPEEQRGFRKGGEVFIGANLHLGAVQGTDRQAKRKEQEDAIESYAKSKGVWIEDIEAKYGQPHTNGAESNIWFDVESNTVTKSMSPNFDKETGGVGAHRNLQELFDRIVFHNYLEPSAPLKVVGFGRSKNGSFEVILEQPLVMAARDGDSAVVMDSDQIASHMKKLGFARNVNVFGITTYSNKDFEITDLHSGNIVQMENGSVVLLDAIIKPLGFKKKRLSKGTKNFFDNNSMRSDSMGVEEKQRALDLEVATAEYQSARAKYAAKLKELARAMNGDQRDLFGNKAVDQGRQGNLFGETGNIDADFDDILAPYKAAVDKAAREVNRIRNMQVNNTGTLFSKDFSEDVGEVLYTISAITGNKQLKGLKGDSVSVGLLNQIASSSQTQPIQRTIISEVLEMDKFKGKKKIGYKDFLQEISDRVLPLTVIESDGYAMYGADAVGMDDFSGKSHIYNSTLDHGYVGHFSGDLGTRDLVSVARVREEYSDQVEYSAELKRGMYFVDFLNREGSIVIPSSRMDELLLDNFPESTENLKNALLDLKEGETLKFLSVVKDRKVSNGDLSVGSTGLNREDAIAGLVKKSSANGSLVLEVVEMDGSYAVVRSDVALTADNLTESVLTVTTSQARAEQYIKDIQKAESVNKGLFGHARVWDDGDGNVYVVEVQSDIYQKMRAEEALWDSYVRDESLLSDKQKRIAKGMDLVRFRQARSRLIDLEYLLDKFGPSARAINEEYLKTGEINVISAYEGPARVIDIVSKDGVELYKEDGVELYKAVDAKGKTISTIPRENISKQEYLRIANNRVQSGLMPFGWSLEVNGNGNFYGLKYSEYGNQRMETPEGTKESVFDFLYGGDSDNRSLTVRASAVFFDGGKMTAEGVDVPPKRGLLAEIEAEIRLYDEILEAASIQDKQFLAHQKNYTERILREEVKRAADSGAKTLAIPAPKTLAQIEGFLGGGDGFASITTSADPNLPRNGRDYVVGDQIQLDDYGELYLVTEVNDNSVVINPAFDVYDSVEAYFNKELGDFGSTLEEVQELIDSGERFIGGDDLIVLDNGRVFIVRDDITETINQPSFSIDLEAGFDISVLQPEHQTVVRKYQNLVKKFRQEHPNAETVVENDYEWIRIDLSEADKGPVTLFSKAEPSQSLSRAIERNGGNPMSQTADGSPSDLYQRILALPEINGDENLASEYKAQVYSDNFKSWFGDWQSDDLSDVSKVVDENGEPQLVYHGSPNSFDTFDYSRVGQNGTVEGQGFYFTTDLGTAKAFAENNNPIAAFVSSKRVEANRGQKITVDETRSIVKLVAEREAARYGEDIKDGFLSNYGYGDPESTIDMATDSIHDYSDDTVDIASVLINSGVPNDIVAEAFNEVLGVSAFISEGFQGLGQGGGNIYVVTRPNAIKSVFNNGNFSRVEDSVLLDKAETSGDIENKFDRLLSGDDAPLNREIPEPVMEMVSRGQNIPEKYIQQVADLIKGDNYELNANEKLILSNYRNQVMAAYLGDGSGASKNKKSAKYKDGKIYVDFSSYNLQEMQEALFDAIADDGNKEFMSQLVSRLSTSDFFKGYFPETTRIESQEVSGVSDRYSPDRMLESGEVGKSIKAKYDKAEREYGSSDVLTLANGQRVVGRWFVAPFDAVTSSHDPERGFKPTPGFPTQNENGKQVTVNDRDYERDRGAQEFTNMIMNAYDDRAFDPPMVVTVDGITVSGNNKHMAGKVAVKNGKAGKYYEIFETKAKAKGIDVSFMDFEGEGLGLFFEWDEPNPVYNKEVFEVFNADILKVKMESDVLSSIANNLTPRVLGRIIKNIPSSGSLASYYNGSTKKAEELKDLLLSSKILAPNQINTYFFETEDGNLVLTEFADVLLTRIVLSKVLNQKSSIMKSNGTSKRVFNGMVSDASFYLSTASMPKDINPFETINNALRIIDLSENYWSDPSNAAAKNEDQPTKKDNHYKIRSFLKSLELRASDGSTVFETEQFNTEDVVMAYAMLLPKSSRGEFLQALDASYAIEMNERSPSNVFSAEEGNLGTVFSGAIDLLRQKANDPAVKLDMEESELADLESIAENGLTGDTEWEQGTVFSKADADAEILSKIFTDVYMKGTDQAKNALNTAIEKSMTGISDQPSTLFSNFTHEQVARRILFGDKISSSRKKEVLANITSMDQDGLIQVTPLELYNSDKEYFDSQDISLEDVRYAMSSSVDLAPLPSDLESRTVEDQSLDDVPSDEVVSYLTNRGIPRPVAELSAVLHRYMPEDVNATEKSLALAMAIVLPEGRMAFAKLYPWSGPQMEAIMEAYNLTEENFETTITSAYLNHVIAPKSADLFGEFEQFFGFALAEAEKAGLPLSLEMMDHHKRLNPQLVKDRIKNGSTFSYEDVRYIVVDYIVENGVGQYVVEDVDTGLPSILLEDSEVFNNISVDTVAPERTLKSTVDAVKSALGEDFPGLVVDIVSDREFRAQNNGNTAKAMYRFGGKGQIVVNNSSADPKSVFHEAAHVFLMDRFGKGEADIHIFAKSIQAALENGTEFEQSVAAKVKAFVARYNQNDAKIAGMSYDQLTAHEYLAEVTALLADSGSQIQQPNWKKIIDSIVRAVRAIVPSSIDIDIADGEAAVDFINDLAQRMSLGAKVNRSSFAPTSNDLTGGILFSADRPTHFTVGENIDVYTSPVGLDSNLPKVSRKYIDQGKVNKMVKMPSNGRWVVQIGDNYHYADNFYQDENGDLIIKGFAKGMQPDSDLNVEQSELLTDRISRILEVKDISPDVIYEKKKSFWDKNGITLQHINEEYSRLKEENQDAEDVDEIIEKANEFKRSVAVSETMKRLTAINEDWLKAAVRNETIMDKAYSMSVKAAIAEIDDAMAPHVGDVDSLIEFYEAWREDVLLPWAPNQPGAIDPRVLEGVIARTSVRYAALSRTIVADGVADDFMIMVADDLKGMARTAGLSLQGFRSEFTDLATTSQMEMIFDAYAIADAAEVNQRRYGKTRQTVSELLKELENSTGVTQDDIAIMMEDMVADVDVMAAISTDEFAVADLADLIRSAFDDDSIDVDDDGVLFSKSQDNKPFYRLVNKAFNEAYFKRRKADGNSEFLNGVSPISNIKAAIDRVIAEKIATPAFGNMTVEQFYSNNPDVLQRIERAYLRMERSILTDALGTKVGSNTKAVILREYRKNRRANNEDADPDYLGNLAELFEDRENGLSAIDRALDHVANQVKYTTDPKVRVEFVTMYKSLVKSRNMLHAGAGAGPYTNANDLQIFKAINQGIENITEEQFKEMGIDLLDPSPAKVLNYIVAQAGKKGALTIANLATAISNQMNLSPDDTVMIAEAINESYRNRVAERKKAALDAIMTPKTIDAKKSIPLIDKMKNMIESGALSTDAYRKAFAEYYGIKDFSEGQRQRIGELMEGMNSEDPVRVQDSNREFRAIINSVSDSSFKKIMRGINQWRMISLLSGYGTMLVSLSSSFFLMASRRLTSNALLLMRGGLSENGAFRQYWKYRSEHPELFGSVLNMNGAAIGFARNAMKRGAIIHTHEDVASDAISGFDRDANVVVAYMNHALASGDRKKTAKIELDRALSSRGVATTGVVKEKYGVADALSDMFTFFPVMAVRSLQVIDVTLNNNAIERETFLVAWDKAGKDKRLEDGHEEFFQDLYTSLGVAKIADGSNMTFEEQLNDKISVIETERKVLHGNNYVPMTEREKSMVAKQVALDNRGKQFIDEIPEGVSDGVAEILNKNRRSVASLASDRVLDASLLNYNMRGYLTGGVGAMLGRLKNAGVLFGSKKGVYSNVGLVAGFLSSVMFPIVKVVVNNYYNSYQHHPASLFVKAATKRATGIDSVRFNSMTGQTLVNGIPVDDLKKLQNSREGKWLDEAMQKDSDVRMALEAMQETKLDRQDHLVKVAGASMATIGLMLSAFDYEEDEEGDIVATKNDTFWRNFRITGKGTGNYFENKAVWGENRRDNEANFGGIHTRWTESPASYVLGSVGNVGDKADMYQHKLNNPGNEYTKGQEKVTLGTVLKQAAYGSYLSLLGEGFGITSNYISTLWTSMGKSITIDKEIDDLDPEVDLKSVESKQKQLNREMGKIGQVVGSIYQSQGLIPNLYKQTDRLVAEELGEIKNATRTGGAIDGTVAVLGGAAGSYAGTVINNMVATVPIMNDYLLEKRYDIAGNPIPEKYDLILFADRYFQDLKNYEDFVKSDDVMKTLTSSEYLDSGSLFSYRSLAKRMDAKYYMTAEDQNDADELWSLVFNRKVRSEVGRIEKMSETFKARRIEQIAKSVKNDKEYRDFIRSRKKKVSK